MTVMRDEETTEADAEDREYLTVDINLPVEQTCGHVHDIVMYGKPIGVTRACSRRAGHVNDRHRDGEISWKV